MKRQIMTQPDRSIGIFAKMLSITGLCLLMITFLVNGSNAAAQSPLPRIVYMLSGATFDDDGTLSGSFIFDPNPPCVPNDCPRYSGVALTTSGGGAVYQETINYDDSNVIPASGGTLQLNLVPEQQFMLTVGFPVPLGATGVNLLDTAGARSSGTASATPESSRPEASSEWRKVRRPTPTPRPRSTPDRGRPPGNGANPPAGSGDGSTAGGTDQSASPGAGNQQLPSMGSNEWTFALAMLGALALGVLLLRTSRLGDDRPSA